MIFHISGQLFIGYGLLLTFSLLLFNKTILRTLVGHNRKKEPSSDKGKNSDDFVLYANIAIGFCIFFTYALIGGMGTLVACSLLHMHPSWDNQLAMENGIPPALIIMMFTGSIAAFIVCYSIILWIKHLREGNANQSHQTTN